MLDRIVVEQVDGARRHRCVACDYSKAEVALGLGIVQGRLQRPPPSSEALPVNVLHFQEDLEEKLDDDRDEAPS